MATSEPVRVMLVDDEPDMRLLLEILLAEEPDLEVVASVDGAAPALAQVAAARPDVALVDARMPLLDGFELAPRLLAAAPGLRVAVLSSLVDAVVERRASAAGAAACLSKGELDELPGLVRRLAGR